MLMKTWIRTACVALAAGALFPAAAHAGTWCSSGKTVRFAGVTWESGSFTSEVLRYIAEKGYGCKTDTVPGSTAATETALARNDLQVWGEQWTGRSEIIAKGVADGQVKLIGDTLPGGTNEGWYVPEYVVKGDPARGIKPVAPNLKRDALTCTVTVSPGFCAANAIGANAIKILRLNIRHSD